ncbi:hypothetical protein OCU04_004159 [Sclerotinia nivalis]|uniref:Fe2OG dioxygenase domain-containing protein n=1 Tax=Sclerotinia nivalis TaxID=352851 RepID=A0A9X0APW0_9HELO|nr:hypothetical protein OCU04_004159 [Sclerotinia nivalis]
MEYSVQEDYSSIPFPEGLPCIDLPRVSLKRLLENDEAEAQKIFDICISVGFFYLDLTDHPTGKKMWQQCCEAYHAGQETLPHVSMEEKLAYKARERIGVFDMGYKCPSIDKNGQPRFSEAFNIPLYELLVDEKSGFQLPAWLSKYKELFENLLRQGNMICNILHEILEQKLQVSPGALTSLHHVTDPSNDFLRILRYPGTTAVENPNQVNFPPHRDSVSIAMLFTLVGGLQILDPKFDMHAAKNGNEDGWRWVKPVDGHVIVNLGDALAILTNGVLKSGFHRVVTSPKDQAPLDKYSVLLCCRPKLSTLMMPLTSPIIPPLTAEQKKEPVQTCDEWGATNVQKVYTVLENR